MDGLPRFQGGPDEEVRIVDVNVRETGRSPFVVGGRWRRPPYSTRTEDLSATSHHFKTDV